LEASKQLKTTGTAWPLNNLLHIKSDLEKTLCVKCSDAFSPFSTPMLHMLGYTCISALEPLKTFSL